MNSTLNFIEQLWEIYLGIDAFLWWHVFFSWKTTTSMKSLGGQRSAAGQKVVLLRIAVQMDAWVRILAVGSPIPVCSPPPARKDGKAMIHFWQGCKLQRRNTSMDKKLLDVINSHHDLSHLPVINGFLHHCLHADGCILRMDRGLWQILVGAWCCRSVICYFF